MRGSLNSTAALQRIEKKIASFSSQYFSYEKKNDVPH
jgi:hypothetical protein